MNKVVCWLVWNIDPTSQLNSKSDSPEALEALAKYGRPDRIVLDYPGEEELDEKGQPTSGFIFTEHVGYILDVATLALLEKENETC